MIRHFQHVLRIVIWLFVCFYSAKYFEVSWLTILMHFLYALFCVVVLLVMSWIHLAAEKFYDDKKKRQQGPSHD